MQYYVISLYIFSSQRIWIKIRQHKLNKKYLIPFKLHNNSMVYIILIPFEFAGFNDEECSNK